MHIKLSFGRTPEHGYALIQLPQEGEAHGKTIANWPQSSVSGEAHAIHLSDCAVGKLVRESDPGTQFSYVLFGLPQ